MWVAQNSDVVAHNTDGQGHWIAEDGEKNGKKLQRPKQQQTGKEGNTKNKQTKVGQKKSHEGQRKK